MLIVPPVSGRLRRVVDVPSWNRPADADRDVVRVRCRPRRSGHLVDRDLVVALGADDDDLVADRRVRHLGQVDAAVLERDRLEDRRAAAADQQAPARTPPEAVADAERDDPERMPREAATGGGPAIVVVDLLTWISGCGASESRSGRRLLGRRAARDDPK